MNQRARFAKTGCIPVLLIVLLVASVFDFTYRSERDIKAGVYANLNEAAHNQIIAFHTKLDGLYAALDAFAAEIAVHESPGKEKRTAHLNMIRNACNFDCVYFIGMDGWGLNQKGREINLSAQDYFQQGRRGERATVFVASAGGAKNPFIGLAVPTIRNGKVTGVLYARYDTQKFIRLIDSLSPAKTDKTYVIEPTGRVVLATHDAKTTNFFAFFGKPGFKADIAKKTIAADIKTGRTNTFTYTLAGETYCATYSPLQIPGCDWYMVTTAVQKNVALLDHKIARHSFLLILKISLLGLILLWFIFRKERAHRRAVEKMAHTDSLTGLLNHDSGLTEMEAFLDAGKNAGLHALLMIDIDNFKQINDQLGHQKGDLALRQAAAAIKDTFCSSDIVGRVGGDEFLVLLKQITSMELCRQKAAALCDALHAIRIDGGAAPFRLSCSVGVTICTAGKPFDALYREADLALYQAKRSGKNRFHIYAVPVMLEEA